MLHGPRPRTCARVPQGPQKVMRPTHTEPIVGAVPEECARGHRSPHRRSSESNHTGVHVGAQQCRGAARYSTVNPPLAQQILASFSHAGTRPPPPHLPSKTHTNEDVLNNLADSDFAFCAVLFPISCAGQHGLPGQVARPAPKGRTNSAEATVDMCEVGGGGYGPGWVRHIERACSVRSISSTAGSIRHAWHLPSFCTPC